jgi:hypothetical protein
MPILKERNISPKPGRAYSSGQYYTVNRSGRLTKVERARIKAERKILRRELREKGIKSRIEFEQIARDLGLVLDEGRKAHTLAFLNFSWAKLMSAIGVKGILLGSVALLTTMFMMSALAEKAGSFTINLTAEMLKAGFVLSETKDFAEEKSRLFSQEMEEVNNITVEDISADVDNIDGSHNDTNYIAYTFYIKNTGKLVSSYNYYLKLDSETMNVASAIWLMFFEDGKQVIYAKKSSDGNPEELYGFKTVPFGDCAYDYDKQYYEEDGKYGLVTTPFVDEKIVVQGTVGDVEPGDTHKYTVVMWVEGNDPECTDDIFGGYAKFSMDFKKGDSEDDSGIFKGIYRTEYDDYTEEYGNDLQPKETNNIRETTASAVKPDD